MKVICINEKWRKSSRVINNPAPHVGEECEVIGTVNSNELLQKIEGAMAGVFYILKGYKDNFHASHFATLPTADAEEIDQQEKEAIINIEKQLV